MYFKVDPDAVKYLDNVLELGMVTEVTPSYWTINPFPYRT